MALNPRMADWRGRTVWLVGASTGIGRATASALHAQGAKVVVSARSAGALNAFVDAHPGARAQPLDATDPLAVKAAASALAAQGAIDCVLYCAGHYHAMNTTTINMADLLQHNQINYLGALYLLDVVLPQMLAQPLNQHTGQRGHISLMGSVAGYRGLPNSLAYSPTKAALINLAETLYLDLQAQCVGVSLINPGFVDTPLTRQNQFKMPALITSEQAAQEILHGWARGEFEIHFPKRFTRWMKALQLLPYPAFFAATRRLKPA
jgi:NAD(P)-dependent dehydrogenase (short-subunit alcohol dehydrogenase family)